MVTVGGIDANTGVAALLRFFFGVDFDGKGDPSFLGAIAEEADHVAILHVDLTIAVGAADVRVDAHEYTFMSSRTESGPWTSNNRLAAVVA